MMQLVTNIPDIPLTEILRAEYVQKCISLRYFVIFFTIRYLDLLECITGFFQATIYLESGFLLMFSKKYVLQMFKNVMNVKKPQ